MQEEKKGHLSFSPAELSCTAVLGGHQCTAGTLTNDLITAAPGTLTRLPGGRRAGPRSQRCCSSQRFRGCTSLQVPTSPGQRDPAPGGSPWVSRSLAPGTAQLTRAPSGTPGPQGPRGRSRGSHPLPRGSCTPTWLRKADDLVASLVVVGAPAGTARLQPPQGAGHGSAGHGVSEPRPLAEPQLLQQLPLGRFLQQPPLRAHRTRRAAGLRRRAQHRR